MASVTIGTQHTYQGIAPVTISTKDRRQGTYLLGKPGAGKSTLMQNMIVQDIRQGSPVCLIDPHGDLVEELLCHIPKSRTNDVVYLNVADIEYPLGLNILQTTGSQDKELVASSTVSIFKHIWADSWGPRLERILFAATAALLDMPQSTLLDVYRMLVDENFRSDVVKHIQDPVVRMFWEEVFGRWSERILNGKSIFLVNLSKGRIGEDRANLLGSIVITKLYLAALERQAIPESERQDFYLYIDEAHSFTTTTFSSILSESRKYRLNLILGHQYLEQMPQHIQHSIFGNIGTWIVFRVGAEDAQVLESEFAPYIKPEQLRRQANYRMAYKLLVNGVSAIPSSTTTPAPLKLRGDEADPETVVRVSRERFGRSRKRVEEQITNRWKGSSLSLQARQRP